jgi:hypothetical protein
MTARVNPRCNETAPSSAAGAEASNNSTKDDGARAHQESIVPCRGVFVNPAAYRVGGTAGKGRTPTDPSPVKIPASLRPNVFRGAALTSAVSACAIVESTATAETCGADSSRARVARRRAWTTRGASGMTGGTPGMATGAPVCTVTSATWGTGPGTDTISGRAIKKVVTSAATVCPARSRFCACDSRTGAAGRGPDDVVGFTRGKGPKTAPLSAAAGNAA